MMKSIILFLAIGVAGVIIPVDEMHAQETQTLISNNITHGGFGAPIFGVTSVNGQPSYLRGVRGAWVINLTGEHTVNIGLARYRTRTDFSPAEWSGTDTDVPDMRTKYGGFELEYINRTYRLVHFSIQTLMGSGTVRYSGNNPDLNKTSDNYFVLQPGVNLNLNITRWFRLGGGLFYRYADGVNLEGTGSNDLSGIVSFVGLRFGKF